MEEVNQNPNTKVPLFYKKELIIQGGIILVVSLVCCLLSLLITISDQTITLGEIVVKTDYILPSFLFSGIASLIVLASSIFIKCSPQQPILNKASKWVILGILYLLGMVAYFVLIVAQGLLNFPFPVAVFLASVIELIYFYLMIKLYLFDYIQSKAIFYEILRFGLVGIIASIFDFVTCFLFEYYIIPSTFEPIAITVISVTMGFIVGVTVNYICSVYMVFKSTTDKNKSKTAFGRFLFVALSAVGLFIGIGLQYLFYDTLQLGYVTTFIIRTLIVLVWNYLSRKYFIFK